MNLLSSKTSIFSFLFSFFSIADIQYFQIYDSVILAISSIAPVVWQSFQNPNWLSESLPVISISFSSLASIGSLNHCPSAFSQQKGKLLLRVTTYSNHNKLCHFIFSLKYETFIS